MEAVNSNEIFINMRKNQIKGEQKNYGEMTQSSAYNILSTNSLFEYTNTLKRSILFITLLDGIIKFYCQQCLL